MEVPKIKRRGRLKIEMKKVEDHSKRMTTFTKRRQGLFKKAGELSELFGAKIAVIAFSESGKPYSCGDVDSVFDQYLTGKVPDDSDTTEEGGKKPVVAEEEKDTGFWWVKPVEETMLGWLKEYEVAILELKKSVEAKLVEVRRVKAEAKASSSSSLSSNSLDRNHSVIVNDTDNIHYRYDKFVYDQYRNEDFANFDFGRFGLHDGGFE
ncbi:hypothetical protein ACOSP7_019893 [Xanthoceras sorbifolium]